MTDVATVTATQQPLVSAADRNLDPLAAERFAAALLDATAAAPAAATPSARAGSVPVALGGRFITLGQMAAGDFDQVGAGIWGAAPPPSAIATNVEGAATLRALGPGSADAGAVIQAAERYLGVPYKWGGTSPTTGFDCSGFVQRVYADLGISLPRVSIDQSRAGTAVPSLAEAQPGDLVFWRGSPNHIGIYAGNGQMIEAPRAGEVVRYRDITSRPPHEIRRVS